MIVAGRRAIAAITQSVLVAVVHVSVIVPGCCCDLVAGVVELVTVLVLASLAPMLRQADDRMVVTLPSVSNQRTVCCFTEDKANNKVGYHAEACRGLRVIRDASAIGRHLTFHPDHAFFGLEHPQDKSFIGATPSVVLRASFIGRGL